jgi:bifunctional non-homologous end joining protein LigD
MAKLRRLTKKAALPSSSSSYSKAREEYRWSAMFSYVFDILFLEGKGLREQPLTARRKLLANLLKKAPENVRLSDELRGSKDELLRVAQEFGLEGLVDKKPNWIYEGGRRSGAWVKFKITKSQEFVIGGYSGPRIPSLLT